MTVFHDPATGADSGHPTTRPGRDRSPDRLHREALGALAPPHGHVAAIHERGRCLIPATRTPRLEPVLPAWSPSCPPVDPPRIAAGGPNLAAWALMPAPA